MAEEAEDMWHIYNLIRIGDIIKASTIRKVDIYLQRKFNLKTVPFQVVSETSTGTTSSQRVHTMLTVSVESIDFDPGAQELHLKGRNIEENDIVKLGAYHTIDLEPNRKFTLQKTEWDSIDLGESLNCKCLQ